MSDREVHYLDLLEVGRKIQAREMTSMAVTAALLARIEAVDSRLKSYVTVMADTAMASAKKADDELDGAVVRGPMHGVPLAVKDLFWTVDYPTTHGMPIRRDFMATTDATVITRLREAGAVILGKLQQTEGAFADHCLTGVAPANPWDAELWSGVSSSGPGVATAAGLAFGTIGTDTGGSIRFPCAANGATGVKPTWGRVSRFGACELAASLDHIGPIARSAADAAAILAAIAGADRHDPTAASLHVPDYLNIMTQGFGGLRIGVDTRWAFGDVQGEVCDVLREVLTIAAEQGAHIQEIRFPETRQMIADWPSLCSIEAAVAHEASFPARRNEYSTNLAGLIDLGRSLSATDYQKLLLHRADFTGRLRRLFQSVDLVVAPTLARVVPTAAQWATICKDPAELSDMLRYTAPFNMSGNPTITLPGGVAGNGAPITFQFIAPDFREDLLFRAGWGYQNATNWHRRHPSL